MTFDRERLRSLDMTTEYHLSLVPQRVLKPGQVLTGETDFTIRTDQFQVERIVSALPRLSPVCREIPAGGSLQVVSPRATTPYRLRRDAPAAYQQIPLVAHGGSSVEQLFWYQDGVLVATGAPDTTLFLPPQAGIHHLVVVDNAGQSASITYQAE